MLTRLILRVPGVLCGGAFRYRFTNSPIPLREYRGGVALWYLTHRDLRDFFVRRDVDDRYRIRSRVGDVDALAVGRERQPVRMVADFRLAEHLQVRQREEVDARVHLAQHAERLAVGGDGEAVRRRALQSFGYLLGLGQLGQLDLVPELVRREIDGREAVEAGELHEDPLGRTVRVRVERHRPHAFSCRDGPEDFFRLLIDHADLAARNRAGDHELAVRRHVDVVNPAFGPDALHARQCPRVDDVDRAGAGDDGDVDALAVLADGHVVRMVRQRDVLGDLQRLQVRDVERRLGFVGDVEAAAVGRGPRAVVDIAVLDLPDNLARLRINQHQDVAGGVGLDNPDRGRLQREGCQDGKGEHSRKFGRHYLFSRRVPFLSRRRGPTPGAVGSRLPLADTSHAARRALAWGYSRRRPTHFKLHGHVADP